MMSDAVRFYQALSDMPTRDYPIRDAFQTFYHEYAASHFVSTEQSKAARCTEHLKWIQTAELLTLKKNQSLQNPILFLVEFMWSEEDN